FGESQQLVPALVIPLHDYRGEICGYQIRPDAPRTLKGKIVKYESPAGSRLTIDAPACVRDLLGLPDRPLWITEGSKKADAAAARGICCVCLLGVWGWRGKNEQGGSTALPDWESIALKGREVVLAFDSDVTIKKQVRAALCRLTSFLNSRGARVRICMLQP